MILFSLMILFQITGRRFSIVLLIEYFDTPGQPGSRSWNAEPSQSSNRPVLPHKIQNLNLNSVLYMKMHYVTAQVHKLHCIL